ncbi:MAG TPA: cyclic nucleotide-binding domain-containing protein, partial [Myxococcaceae bacterium]|nr:cyclic nucleotide-binding domain-containing protein [Myxococcaceae bacterium]
MPDFDDDPINRLLRSVGMESRREEMVATLSEADVRRVSRFGEKRSYADGELMFEAGTPFPGMVVVLSGQASITLRDPLGHSVSLGEQGPGNFLGDVGQLSGARSIVDGRAVGPVDAGA